MGLRWDPERHRWHGTTTAEQVRELCERFGLEVRCFGDLEAPPNRPAAPQSALPGPGPGPAPITVTVPSRDPARRPNDGARTRVEARVAYPAPCGEPDETVTPTRRFSLLEITSGLPDDSREEDEREEARRLRDLRGRIKAARAAISATPGAEQVLRQDWVKAARCYARFGIAEAIFRNGVSAGNVTG